MKFQDRKCKELLQCSTIDFDSWSVRYGEHNFFVKDKGIDFAKSCGLRNKLENSYIVES